MEFAPRTLSHQESRVVLSLTEEGRREIAREEIIRLLGVSPQAADRVIRSLRKKGWLERASWGKYLLIPPEHGPQALGYSNLLARASRIADPYYIGFGTAAAHYGFTTQHRNVIYVATPKRRRDRDEPEAKVQIVNPQADKFFGFGPVDVLGYTVLMSDIEKTVIDCIDRPDLAGGIGEAAVIAARASQRIDWRKAAQYLERIGQIALVRRFGWLADHAGAEMPEDARAQLLSLSESGDRSFLGPKRAPPDAVGYDPTWRLAVNVPRSELHESAGLGRRKSVRRERGEC